LGEEGGIKGKVYPVTGHEGPEEEQMGVSDHFRTPATLSLGRRPSTQMYSRLGGP